ncbi:MAG TPA: PAS domain S-box protein, partial [Atribacterota bacterium]|nr:PAS domain S-box protein [Atribacterota bacterium]
MLPLVHFFTFLTYIGLLLFLLWKDTQSLLHKVCAGLIGCFTLWSFALMFFYLPATTQGTAPLWDNIASLGWIGYASFYLWFSLIFTDKKNILKNRLIYLLLFTPPLFFIYKKWTGDLISHYILQSWGWAGIWSNSIWTYLFFSYYLILVLTAIGMIYDFGKRTKIPFKQKQAQIIFTTSFISLTIGFFTEFLLPLLILVQLPTSGNVVNLILSTGIIYAIAKYKLVMLSPGLAARQIISTIADSLLIMDREGHIDSVNQALLNLSGYQKKELLKKSIGLLFQKSDIEKICPYPSSFKETVNRIELNLKTKSGKQIPVILSCAPIIDDIGETAGIVGILTEITELKRVQKILQNSQAEALSLFQHSPLAGICHDENGLILNINNKFTELFGYTLGEMKGRNINEGMIFPDEKAVQESEELTRNSLAGKDIRHETVRRKKDGTLVPVYITVAEVLKQGTEKAIIAFYQDISKEKEYLKKVEESEQKFRSLFENMPAAYYQTDIKGNLLTVNPYGIRLMGYQSLAEVMGKNMAEDFYYQPEQRLKFLEALQNNEGKVADYEIILKNREGKPITVGTNSRYYYNEKEEIAGVEGIFADISKRKLSEEALRKSKQEFTSLFQSHSEALVYIDNQSNISDVNRRFTELFGYSLAEIKGKNINSGIIHTSEMISEGKEQDRIALSEGYTNYETIRKKKDGTVFPVSISASPVIIDGKAIGIIATYLDITERKRTEEALRKSEQEFASIFNSNPEATVYSDGKGDIININPRFTELFGYTLEEIKGKNIDSGLIQPPERIKEAKELTNRGLNKGYQCFETIRKKKNGSLFPVLISGSPVIIDGECKGIIGTYSDISERKKLEEQLKKMAQTDTLSDCFNRRHSMELLERQMKLAKRNGSPLLVAYFDVDNLKGINDRFGHQTGDHVLKEVSHLFKSTFREVDIICRMGGDEFVIVFTDYSLQQDHLIRE